MENKINRIIALLVIVLFLMPPGNLADEHAVAAPAAGGAPSVVGAPAPGQNFASLSPAEQAEQLKRVYDPALAKEFFAKPENVGLEPEVDRQYFSDKTNIGKNPDADDKFFSGTYDDQKAKATSRKNFNDHKESASEYLTQKFKGPYTVTELSEDFFYDPNAEGGGLMINRGKTVRFSQFADDQKIKSIETTADGFLIIREKEGVTHDIQIKGTAENEIIYDPKSGQLSFKSPEGKVQDFTIRSENNPNVQFDLKKDGTIKVSGPVSGSAIVNERLVEFTNRVGDLVLSSNGDISAENAEVITPRVYADGKFTKKGDDIEAQAHSDRNRENLDTTGETVILDRTTNVGVKTQGQVGDNKVKIHLDKISSNSEFAPQPVATTLTTTDSTATDGIETEAPTPAQQTAIAAEKAKKRQAEAEQARQTARDLKPAKGDLGGNAEVWIKKEKNNQVIVTAKGKVNVGNYYYSGNTPPIIDENQPQFTGANGKSEFDSNLGVSSVVNVRGQAVYQDRQYADISSRQDGSSMKITRDGGNEQDVMVANCFTCTNGKVMDIAKNVYLTDSRTGISDSATSMELNIQVNIDENGMTYDYSSSDLGKLSALQTEGNRIGIGRDLIMKVPCGEIECNFQFAKDKDKKLVGYYEQYNSVTKEKSPPIEINTNVGEVLGDASIITSEKNIAELEKMETIISEGKIKDLAKLDFDKDPQLRTFLIKKYGLDIDNLDNDKYVKKVVKAIQYREKANKYLERLRAEGIEINEDGKPLTSEAAEAINKLSKSKGRKLWWYSAAMIQLNKAKIEEVEAASCVESEKCQITSEKAKENKKKLKKEVRKFRKIRDVMQEESRIRKVKRQIKEGNIPDTANKDLQRAKQLKGSREDVRIQIWDRKNELKKVQTQIESIERDGDYSPAVQEELDRLMILVDEHEANLLDLREESIYLDQEVEQIVTSYTKNRPDIAVDLAKESGATDLAEKLNAQLAQYDESAAERRKTSINVQLESEREDVAWEAGVTAWQPSEEGQLDAIISKTKVGVVPLGGQQARAEITKHRADMITTTRELEKTTQELTLVQNQMKTIQKKNKEGTLTAKDLAVHKTLQKRFDALNEKKKNVGKTYIELQKKVLKTIEPFANERPDFARDLAIDAGDLDLATYYNQHVWADDEGVKNKQLELDMLQSMETGEAYGSAREKFEEENTEIFNYALIKDFQLKMDQGDHTSAAAIADKIDGSLDEKSRKAKERANNLLKSAVLKDAAHQTNKIFNLEAKINRGEISGDGFADEYGYVLSEFSGTRGQSQRNLKTKKDEADLIDAALTSLMIKNPKMTIPEAINIIQSGQFTKDDLLLNFQNSRRDEINDVMFNSYDADGNPVKKLIVSHNTAFLRSLEKRYSGQQLNLEDQAHLTLEAGELQRVYEATPGTDTAQNFEKMNIQSGMGRLAEFSQSDDEDAKRAALEGILDDMQSLQSDMVTERAERDFKALNEEEGLSYLAAGATSILSIGSKTLSPLNVVALAGENTVNEMYTELRRRSVTELQKTNEEIILMNMAIRQLHKTINPTTGKKFTSDESIAVIKTGQIDGNTPFDRKTFLAGFKTEKQKKFWGEKFDKQFDPYYRSSNVPSGHDPNKEKMKISQNSAFLKVLEESSQGKIASAESMAAYKLEGLEKRRSSLDGKTADLESEYAALAQEDKWGLAGQIAQSRIAELDRSIDSPLSDYISSKIGLDLRITNRVSDKWGDVAIEAATVIDIPGFGLAVKGLGKLGNFVAGTKTGQKLITGVKTSAVGQKVISGTTKLSALGSKVYSGTKTAILGSKETKLALSSLKSQLRTADFLGDTKRIGALTDKIADTERILAAEVKAAAGATIFSTAKAHLHFSDDAVEFGRAMVDGQQQLKSLNKELAAAKVSDNVDEVARLTTEIAGTTKEIDEVSKVHKAMKLAESSKSIQRSQTALGKKRFFNKKLQAASDEFLEAQTAFHSASKSQKLERADDLIAASTKMNNIEESVKVTSRIKNNFAARRTETKLDDLASEGMVIAFTPNEGALIDWEAINAVEDIAKKEQLTKKAKSVEVALSDTDVKARVTERLRASSLERGVSVNADNVNKGIVVSGTPRLKIADEEVEAIGKGIDELVDSGSTVKVRDGKVEFENVHPTQRKKAIELKEQIENSGLDLVNVETRIADEEARALDVAESGIADAERVKKSLREQHNPELVGPEIVPDVTPSSVTDNLAGGNVEDNLDRAVSGIADVDQPIALSSKTSNVKWDPNVERWRGPDGKFVKVEVDDAYKWNTKAKKYEYASGPKKGEFASFDEVTEVATTTTTTELTGKTSLDELIDAGVSEEKLIEGFADGYKGEMIILESKNGKMYQGRVVGTQDDVLSIVDEVGDVTKIKTNEINVASMGIVLDASSAPSGGAWDDLTAANTKLNDALETTGTRLSDNANPNLLSAKEAKRQVVEDLAEFRTLSEDLAKSELDIDKVDLLADLKNRFVSPGDELDEYVRITSIDNPTKADLKELKTLLDRIHFREGIANTDPTEVNVIIESLLNTQGLGHSNLDEIAKATTTQERMKIVNDRAEEVIRQYAKGFEAQTGTHIRANPKQVGYMREHLKIQMEMLTKLDDSGYLDKLAKSQGISKEEVMLNFQTKIADSLQKGIIHDGLLITNGVGGKSGQIRIGTGVARLRESNGYDHILAVQLRARDALNTQMKVVDLQPEHFMEIYEAVAYHDLAKGSLWNNAGGMAEAKIAGASLSDTHVVAASKYVEADKAKLVGLYGEEGYNRILALATHHDDTHFLKLNKNSIFEAQFNAITSADNTAGSATRSIDGTRVFQDKLVEAVNVEGNQEILSLALRIDEGKGAGLIDKTKTIESLKQRAIDNILVAAEKGDIGWDQGELAIRAMEDDFSGMAARFMRRTQPAGEMKVSMGDNGIIIFEQSLSTVAGKIDDAHQGSIFEAQKGLTDVYWDEVTIRPKGQKVSFDGDCDSCRVFEIEEGGAGAVFEIGKDGSKTPIEIKNADGDLVPLTRKKFKKDYLPNELESTGTELHKARAKGTNLETKLDGSATPGTFSRTDDYTLEIHFKGEETTASLPQQEFLAAGTKTKKELQKTEEVISQANTKFEQAKKVIDSESSKIVTEAQIDEIAKTIGIDDPDFDDLIRAMKKDLNDGVKLTEKDAAGFVDLMKDDYASKQYNKYFGVGEKSPLENVPSVVNIDGVSTTVKLNPVPEIEEFIRLSEKTAAGTATSEDLSKLKILESDVGIYGNEMNEYVQLKKTINPSESQLERLTQLENVIAQRELERVELIKSSFDEALEIVKKGQSQNLENEEIDLIMLQIKDFKNINPDDLGERIEAGKKILKVKEAHLIHEAERIHALGLIKNKALEKVIKPLDNTASAYSYGSSKPVQEEFAESDNVATTSS